MACAVIMQRARHCATFSQNASKSEAVVRPDSLSTTRVPPNASFHHDKSGMFINDFANLKPANRDASGPTFFSSAST